MVSKSSGSAIASVSAPSSMATGKMQAWRRKRGDRPSSSGAEGGAASCAMGRPELFGKRGQQIALGEVAHIDQDLAELVAALALQFERALQIFRPRSGRSIRIWPSGWCGRGIHVVQSSSLLDQGGELRRSGVVGRGIQQFLLFSRQDHALGEAARVLPAVIEQERFHHDVFVRRQARQLTGSRSPSDLSWILSGLRACGSCGRAASSALLPRWAAENGLRSAERLTTRFISTVKTAP